MSTTPDRDLTGPDGSPSPDAGPGTGEAGDSGTAEEGTGGALNNRDGTAGADTGASGERDASDDASVPDRPATGATAPSGESGDREHPPGDDGGPSDRAAPPPSPGRVKTLVATALGIIVSTLLAAVVTTYFDVWTSSRSPVPASEAIHAESEVWWDLTRDTKAVRLTGPVDTGDLQRDYPDGDVALDGLVEAGGTYAGMVRIRLTLMNFTKVPVSVTGIRARVIEEKPTPGGALLHCGGPQGEVGITRVRIDLGSPKKEAQEYDGDDAVGQYPTRGMQLAKQDEPAIFDIRVEDGKATYSYVLDVAYTQGKKKGQIVVDDSGKPFALAPVEGDASHTYRCDHSLTSWTRIR